MVLIGIISLVAAAIIAITFSNRIAKPIQSVAGSVIEVAVLILRPLFNAFL